jgi:hypothetical protein
MGTATFIAMIAMAQPDPAAAALILAIRGPTPRKGAFTIDFPKTPNASGRLSSEGRERIYLDNDGDQLFLITVASATWARVAARRCSANTCAVSPWPMMRPLVQQEDHLGREPA